MRIVRIVTARPGKTGEHIRVRGGGGEAEGALEESTGQWMLKMKPEEMSVLGLVKGQSVALWRDAHGWRLGPYIGIMTVLRPSGRKGFGSLRGRRDNYHALARIGGEQGSVVFVFAAEKMNYRSKRVVGFGRSAAGHWLAREFPWPDVIYNRVPDRKSEELPAVRLVKNKFPAAGGAIFNPQFLDKWSLYAWLARDEELARFLPKTRVLRSVIDLSRLLKAHGVVYLKPISGFAGQGIMQVKELQSGFLLRYRNGVQVKQEHLPDIQSLVKAVQFRKAPGTYIVQQGLSLATYRGSIFDARVLVQKNAQGSWDLTGIGIRVAGHGGFTTHVPCGGYLASVGGVLKKAFGETPETPDGVYQRVKTLALAIAMSIEKNLGKELGEMSMDIGITKDRKCYFFEANAKPMKFDEPHIRRLSLCRLVEYSRYLAGRRRVRGGNHANT